MSKIRMGMVGGGPGAFIGAVHRMAASLDGDIELVCGAFSRSAERSRQTAAALGLAPQRGYDDYRAMLAGEERLPADERMQFVTIVTANDSHFEIADASLRRGFHVFCEKPATMNIDQARQLATLVADCGCRFALAHTYTGYPMVQEARQRIADGRIGEVTRVLVEYTQGWLSPIAMTTGDAGIWRLDPARAGGSCAMGDIGVHAANMAEFVTGLDIDEVLADIRSVVPGRVLDDDGALLMKLSNGARGVLVASQTCTGEENNLILRVYGSKGGLVWAQQEPNTLALRFAERPDETIRSGDPYTGAAARACTRLPGGHPEGYIEAFANLYRAFAADIADAPRPDWRAAVATPGIEAAVRGMAFLDAVLDSSRQGSVWRKVG